MADASGQVTHEVSVVRDSQNGLTRDESGTSRTAPFAYVRVGLTLAAARRWWGDRLSV